MRGVSGVVAMMLISEYLDRCVHFAQLAADPANAAIKEELLKLAAAYGEQANKRVALLAAPPETPKPENAGTTRVKIGAPTSAKKLVF
jgi:hypothetical protein